MTDFFDDDLEKVRRREPANDLSLGPGSKKVEETGRFEAPQGGGELNLTRMARHREQVEDQVATAMKELERLRQRQEDLQSQKQDLEDLRKKQQQFEVGKREMLERINQTLVGLEKDELKAEQYVDLLSSTRKQFKNRAKEIDQLNDQNWGEEKYRTELNGALTLIEDSNSEYNRTIGKIDSLRSELARQDEPASVAASDSTAPVPSSLRAPLSFVDALKLGAAFTMPLTAVLLLILLIHYLLTVGLL